LCFKYPKAYKLLCHRQGILSISGAVLYIGHLSHLRCCPVNRVSFQSIVLPHRAYYPYIVVSIGGIFLISGAVLLLTGGMSMYLSPHRTTSSVDQLETPFIFTFTCSLPCLYSHLLELSATSILSDMLHWVASSVLIC